jgi:hypothetical protein
MVASGESWLEDLMVVYFRWQIDAPADRVAELLEPFVGRESAAHCRLLWDGPERRPVQTERDPRVPRPQNQAIRVQLTVTNRFIWGYDNASPLYRVQVTWTSPCSAKSPAKRLGSAIISRKTAVERARLKVGKINPANDL